MAIRHLHLCESEHLETVAVTETFRGETVWSGDVEVFSVSNQPRARKCYAWSDHRGQKNERFTVILELPPVRNAVDAVRLSILSATKKHTQE
jgi:hypothetical protein